MKTARLLMILSVCFSIFGCGSGSSDSSVENPNMGASNGPPPAATGPADASAADPTLEGK